uniref:RING-type domain-containing protein n=1 Tax=Leersia perrieri TaxID=77586 RepID=A0A0D9XVY1_9ORYZ
MSKWAQKGSQEEEIQVSAFSSSSSLVPLSLSLPSASTPHTTNTSSPPPPPSAQEREKAKAIVAHDSSQPPSSIDPSIHRRPDSISSKPRPHHIHTTPRVSNLSPARAIGMMTMSDDGDRTCPLCAEEMDITDQQLKPCKCGYEICVWCWHHIMDMAEKEDTEGRCPACRTRYDKDRIVKMAATCDRTLVDKNVDKKQKTQKVKPKTATVATVEAKKHLASVRVIQRNLVYIVGLPANLCNESILERREYFGQYGKVLKVSISRPTGAPSQQASTNNSISVYITYAKEEEAIRCIQAVHNFVLEGKVLRACFGTTKYCHAWLRNMTCGNPDCLYLHDVGSQEDSFTKDEIISAYTSYLLHGMMIQAQFQKRWKDEIPYKPGIAKETQAVTSLESSLDIDFSTLPSAWNDDDVVSDGVSKGSDEKHVVNDNGKLICSVSSMPAESGHLASKPSTSPKKDVAVNSTRQSSPNCISSQVVAKSELKDGDGDRQVTNTASITPTLVDINDQSNQAAIDTAIENIRSEDTDIDRLSVRVEENQQLDAILNASVVVPLSQSLMLADNKDSTCQPSPDKHRDWCSDLPSSVSPLLNGIENSAVATDKSHVRVLDVTAQASSSPYVHFPNTSSISLWNGKESSHASTSSTMMQPGLSFSIDSTSNMFNGHPEGLGTIYAPSKLPEHLRVKNHQPGAVGAVRIDKAVSVNKDESSIISDILSLEFDPWDESYSTANNFAKMLSASEKNNVLFDAPSWKTKTSSTESRFSFARQDNQGSYSSMRNYRSEQNFSSSSQNSHGNIHQSGIAFQPPEEGFSKSNSLTMLDMLATGTSKPKVSAPPGFSAPARVPPGFSSGFSSQEGLNPPPGFSSHNGPKPPPGFSSQGGSNQMSLQQPRSSHLTNGHWDGWGDLRPGNNAPMPEMSRMLYPTEANNFHMMGSNDLYNRAFGLRIWGQDSETT